MTMDDFSLKLFNNRFEIVIFLGVKKSTCSPSDKFSDGLLLWNQKVLKVNTTIKVFTNYNHTVYVIDEQIYQYEYECVCKTKANNDDSTKKKRQ